MKLMEVYAYPDEAVEIANLIKTRCKATLKQLASPENPLYRGSFSIAGRYNSQAHHIIEKIRADRKPLNTPAETHKIFMDYIESRGGEANRHNSLFVTGNSNETDYGPTSVVFPMGNISFTWSPKVEDPYSCVDLDTYKTMTGSWFTIYSSIIAKMQGYSGTNMPKLPTSVFQKVQSAMQADYEDLSTNRPSAITQMPWHEEVDKIMQGHDTTRRKLLPKTFAALAAAQEDIEDMGFDHYLGSMYPIKTEENSTLAEAIESQHEIMINSSEMQAVYIETGYYFRYVVPLL